MQQPERNQESLVIKYVDSNEVDAMFSAYDFKGRGMGQAKVDDSEGMVHIQLDANESPFYIIYSDAKKKVPFIKAVLY